MNLFAISSILVFISSSVIALFIFLKAGKNKTAKILGVFCISIAIWGVAGYKFSTTLYEKDIVVAWQFGYICCILSIPLYYHFVYCLLGLDRKNRYSKCILVIIYMLAAIFLYFNFFARVFFLPDLKFVFGQFFWTDWVKSRSPLWLFYYISFVWILLNYSFFLLVKAFISSNGIYRNQLKYLILGSMVGWLGAHGCWIVNFRSDIYPYANFLVVIYPIIFAYAIIKHHLLDVNLVITRVGIFIAVYSLVLGVPYFLAFGVRGELIRLLGVNWWIAPLVVLTVLATTGPFIYLYIDKKAQDRLLREQRAYQSVLRNASSGMIRIKDMGKLLNLIVRLIAKTVKLEHVSIYLLDKETNQYSLKALRGNKIFPGSNNFINANSPVVLFLQKDSLPIVSEEVSMRLQDSPDDKTVSGLVGQLAVLGASLIVPSFIDKKLIGILVLGAKKSGKLYSADDLSVFSVLANQAALAIENAQYHIEVNRKQEQLFHAEKLAYVGKMASSIVHEIKNPLTAIKTYCDYVKEKCKTSVVSA